MVIKLILIALLKQKNSYNLNPLTWRLSKCPARHQHIKATFCSRPAHRPFVLGCSRHKRAVLLPCQSGQRICTLTRPQGTLLKSTSSEGGNQQLECAISKRISNKRKCNYFWREYIPNIGMETCGDKQDLHKNYKKLSANTPLASDWETHTHR